MGALVGGPLYGLLVVGLFVLGHAIVLTLAAVAGAGLLPTGTHVSWVRLDVVVGVMFLAAAAYYVFRVLNGDVSTALPGEPGGTLP